MGLKVLKEKLGEEKLKNLKNDLIQGMTLNDATAKYSITWDEAKSYKASLNIKKPKTITIEEQQPSIEIAPAIEEAAPIIATVKKEIHKEPWHKCSEEQKIQILAYCKECINAGYIDFAYIGKLFGFRTGDWIRRMLIKENIDFLSAHTAKKSSNITGEEIHQMVIKSRKSSENTITEPAKEESINMYGLEVKEMKKGYPTLVVSLFKDRHNYPSYITDSIFPTAYISKTDMYNYDKIDDIVKTFIDTKIKDSEGNIVKRLDVYTSGLVQSIASLVKVCIKENVTLVLYNYDIDKEKYFPQTININDSLEESNWIKRTFVTGDSKSILDKVYLYKCEEKDFDNNSEAFFRVSYAFYNNETKTKPESKMFFIMKSLTDSWEVYNTLVQECYKDKKFSRVELCLVKNTNERVTYQNITSVRTNNIPLDINI